MSRKRSPPLTHLQKYNQIKRKAKAFHVNVPKPTTASNKAIVTRYHRILFGGYLKRKVKGKRVYNYGLVSGYKVTTKKGSDELLKLYEIKRASRIKVNYFPKSLGKFVRATKDRFVFKTKVGIQSVPRIKALEQREMSIEQKAAWLSSLGVPVDKMFVTIHESIQPQTYDNYMELAKALALAEVIYEGAPVSIRIMQ